MMNMYCPKCNRHYSELEHYCTKCGRKLEKAPNVCSEMKTVLCQHRIFADDDCFCSYCGAMTTYARDRMGGTVGKENTDNA